ncbi:energy transducer TonB [Massilia sp. H-1]|nr:energy transducer TonB [Massilia sp. H-1]
MDADGQVREARLYRSSGHRGLDRTALDAGAVQVRPRPVARLSRPRPGRAFSTAGCSTDMI